MTNNALLPAGQNIAISGLAADIELAEVPAADVVSGAPREGTTELGGLANCTTGIWELREGTVTDTEVNELFVVLSGEATIEFLDANDANDANEEKKPVIVQAGDVMRLVAGTRTRWTVTDHIRKVYIAEA